MRNVRVCLGLLFFLFTIGCRPSGSGHTAIAETVSLPGEPREVLICSWNVRNFFDSVDDPNSDEVRTQEEFEQKIEELARVLDSLDADFLAVQEVENVDCLKLLNRALESPYDYLGLVEGNDRQRGIDVGFFSRVPVESVTSHAATDLPDHPDVSDRYRFSRDCLEVRLATEPPVTLLINHLKSQRGDKKRSAAKRFVQAQGIVSIARQVDPGGWRAVLVIGDLNDRPDSWALSPLFEAFTDPFAHLSSEERLTHRYRNGGSALDHILLDPEAAAVSQPGRVWQEIGRSTSDHNPIGVSLRLKVSPEKGNKNVWTENR